MMIEISEATLVRVVRALKYVAHHEAALSRPPNLVRMADTLEHQDALYLAAQGKEQKGLLKASAGPSPKDRAKAEPS